MPGPNDYNLVVVEGEDGKPTTDIRPGLGKDELTEKDRLAMQSRSGQALQKLKAEVEKEGAALDEKARALEIKDEQQEAKQRELEARERALLERERRARQPVGAGAGDDDTDDKG